MKLRTLIVRGPKFWKFRSYNLKDVFTSMVDAVDARCWARTEDADIKPLSELTKSINSFVKVAC